MNNLANPDTGMFTRAAHAVQSHTQPHGHTARAAHAWIDTLSNRVYRAAERHHRITTAH